MLAYGFFLPAKDALNIRAKKLDISVEEYLLTKMIPHVDDIELLKKDPIEYWRRNIAGVYFEDFKQSEKITSRSGIKDDNRLVFIGYCLRIYCSVNRVEETLSHINRKEVEDLAEILGFVGFEFRDYFVTSHYSIDFGTIDEKEIQEFSLRKLL